jgi:hypothetical protein
MFFLAQNNHWLNVIGFVGWFVGGFIAMMCFASLGDNEEEA